MAYSMIRQNRTSLQLQGIINMIDSKISIQLSHHLWLALYLSFRERFPILINLKAEIVK